MHRAEFRLKLNRALQRRGIRIIRGFLGKLNYTTNRPSIRGLAISEVNVVPLVSLLETNII